MACIYKRGKTWSYSVDLGRDESGKRRKKGKGGFRTQKEAKEAAAILEAELANGVFVNEKKITFGELADQWFTEHSKEIKPTTMCVYVFAVDKLLFFLKNKPAREITKLQYQKVLTNLFKENLSRESIKKINSCANMIFKYGCQYDIIKSNPAQFAKVPRAKETLIRLEDEIPKYLEKEELHLFLETIKESERYEYYVIFLVLAYTGVRRSELAALKWDDIDFSNNTISINKNLYRRGKTEIYTLQTPKTKLSNRIIPTTDNVISELLKLRAVQREEQMRHRHEWHNENFVFTSYRRFGYPINTGRIFDVMRRNLIHAGLNTSLSPHSLRHTHTSLLAEAGTSLEAIMERLGHSNDAITRTIYLHITKDVKKDAAIKFYNLMRSASR